MRILENNSRLDQFGNNTNLLTFMKQKLESETLFFQWILSNEKLQHCYADQSTRPAPLLDQTPLGSVIHLPGHYNLLILHFFSIS